MRPTGRPPTWREALRTCLDDMQRFRTRWLAVERAVGEVHLATALGDDAGRRAMEALVDLFGLRLERRGGVWRVAPTPAEARRRAFEEPGGNTGATGRQVYRRADRGWGLAVTYRREVAPRRRRAPGRRVANAGLRRASRRRLRRVPSGPRYRRPARLRRPDRRPGQAPRRGAAAAARVRGSAGPVPRR